MLHSVQRAHSEDTAPLSTDHRAPREERLDLIIPFLNEEHRIAKTLRAITQLIRDNGWLVRLILVDNGSSDYSVDEVLSSALPDTPIRIVSCSTKGKGAAVRAGVSIATAPFVGYCDADLSVDPEAIGSGLSLLEAGWEVVIGSRRCPGAQYVVRQPVTRQLGSQAFRAAARPLTGAVRDTQCGFKLFHTPTAKALFAHNSVDGFAFDVEIVARALRQQRRIIELPLQWSDDSASSFHPISDGIRSFREMRGVYRSLRQPDIDLPRAV